MRGKKSLGLRILLGMAAVVCGLAIQVSGTILSGVTGLGMLGTTVLTLLGFAVIAYHIYKWAIK